MMASTPTGGSDSVPVCRFWRDGSCRFGESCHFRHPPEEFGVTAGSGGDRGGGRGRGRGRGGRRGGGRGGYRGRGGGGGDYARGDRPNGHDSFSPTQPPSPTAVEPQWPLTSYGFDSQPCVVTGDVSPEELRAYAYASFPQGYSPAVVAREQELVMQHRARIAASRPPMPQ